MDLLDLFKKSLLDKNASRATVKNYLADIRKFLRWFEASFERSFEPTDLTRDTITLYQDTQGGRITEENGELAVPDSQASARSFERYISSLRKFTVFLKNQKLIEANPFDEIQAINSKIEANEDPWKIKEFKNYLYLSGVSPVTSKNYMVDINAFCAWASRILSVENLSDNYFRGIDQSLISSYKERLASVLHLSPTSINRKLSSIRKYLGFAAEKGLLDIEKVQITSYEDIKVFDNISAGALTLQDFKEEQIKGQKTAGKKYSVFPPLRLVQKLFLPYVLLEELVASKIAFAVRGKKLALKASQAIRPSSFFLKRSARQANQPNILGFAPSNLPKEMYAPHKISLAALPFHKKVLHHIRFTRPNWYRKYHNTSFSHYFHFAILIIYASVVGVIIYSNLFQDINSKKALAAPASPPRILSFQGRLTDNNDNPITTGTQIRFQIYDDPTATGAGNLLWQEVDYVSPDQDGIFNQLMGDGSACPGQPLTPQSTPCSIPASVFTDNSTLYLGITIEATPELTPRQRLATVAYAANSESLQGMLPITDVSAGQTNVVLALDSGGDLTIGGSASPTFAATGGQFELSGQTLLLSTTTGSNGNVSIVPDGLGKIDLKKPLINSSANGNIAPGAVEVDDKFAVLATESAVAAFVVNNNTTGGDIFAASSSGTTRFQIANNGDINFAAGAALDTLTTGTLSIGSTRATTINIGRSGQGITLPGFTGQNGALYGTSGTGVLAQATTATPGLCLVSGSSNPSWASCSGGGGGGISWWNVSNGLLYPINSTLDFAVGGTASSAAKFAILNVNSGTPTASVSAGTAGASFLTADGYLSTTARQNLTLGNSSTYNTTGNILLNPNGTGFVGIGTSNPLSTLNVVGNVCIGDSTTSCGGLGNGQLRVRGAGGIVDLKATGGAIDLSTTNPLFINNNSNQDLYINGGTSNGKVGIGTITPLARFDLRGADATSTIASISGQTLGAALQVDNTGSGNQIVASKSGKTVFIVDNNGNVSVGPNGSGKLTAAIVDPYLVQNQYTTGNTTLTFQTMAASNGDFLFKNQNTDLLKIMQSGNIIPQQSNLDIGSNANPFNNIYANNFISTGTIAGFWQRNNGALAPLNITDDLLLGSTSTASAKFAFTNVAGGTPTASISANSGNNATYLTGDGSLGTVNKQTLNLGSATTGLIKVLNTSASPFATFDTLNSRFGVGTNPTIGSTFVASGPNTGNTTIADFQTNGSSRFTVNTSNGLTLIAGGNSNGSVAKALVLGLTGGVNITGETIPVQVNAPTWTITGSYANQRLMQLTQPTISAGSALNITGEADTLNVAGAPISAGSAGIANSVGLRINSGTSVAGGVTNAYGLYVDAPTGAANNYAATFATGRVGVGTTAPISQLQVNGAFGSNAAFVANQTNSGDIIAASSSGATKFTIGNTGLVSVLGGLTSDIDTLTGTTLNIGATSATTISLGRTGQNITLPTFTTNGGLIYTNGSGTLTQLTSQGSLGDCLTSNGASSAPAFSSCSGAVASQIFWNQANGALYPKNTGVDLLIGSNATSSAKFAFINVLTGTPTASIAGTTTDANTFLTGNGNLGTTSNQTLTLGGASTGDISLLPRNSTGTVSITSSNSTKAGLIVSQGTTSGTAINLPSTIGTSGIGLNLSANSLVGTGIKFGTGVNAIDNGGVGIDLGSIAGSGVGINIGQTGSSGGNAFTGSLLKILNTHTYNTAGVLNVTGNYVNVSRSENLLGGTTTNLLGDLATFSSNCINSSGNCVDTSNILRLTQNYGRSSGAVLNIVNNGVGSAAAILSNSGGQSALIVNKTGNAGDILTASASGSTKLSLDISGNLRLVGGQASDFDTLTNTTLNIGAANATTLTLGRSGQGITLPGFTGQNGILYGTNGTGVLAQATTSTLGQCLLSGASDPIWGSCGINTNYWQLNNGLLSPGNSTVDFSIGGITTASAKFAITNINSGTPTATISAGTNGATFLTADGYLSTTARQSLTLGNSTTYNTTGNTYINPNTVGNVAIGGTNANAKLEVVGSGANTDFRISRVGNSAAYLSLSSVAGVGVSSQFGINGTTIMTLQLVNPGVGIGTTTPTTNLDVAGSASISANLGFYGASTAHQLNIFDNGTLNIQRSPGGNAGLATSLFIGNTGNVGLGTSSPLSELHVTRPLSFGATGKALAIFDQIENQDILTASSGGATKLVLTNNGSLNLVGGQTSDIDTLTGTTLKIGGSTATTISLGRSGQGITLPGFTAQNGVLYGTNGTGVLAQATTSSIGQCLVSGASNPAWGSCGTNYWQLNNGLLSPGNSTVDFGIGGTASNAAKFAVLNVNSGVPVASVSAGTNGATYLTADGSLATTARQTLTLGNTTTTGGILLNSGTGTTNTAGGFINLTTGTGAGTGAGGSMALTTGAGGTILNGVSGNGGAFSVLAGTGGQGNGGAGNRGDGGAISLTGGIGGGGTNGCCAINGAGGAVTITSGTGGAGTNDAIAGAAGTLTLAGGNGGLGSGGIGTSGAGGNVVIAGGNSGTTTNFSNGNAAGGSVTINGGVGRGTGNGGAFTFAAGTAGSTGAGGAVSITTGIGGSTSGNSGALTLATGTKTNGSFGTISFNQGANTRAIIDANGLLQLGTTSGNSELYVTRPLSFGATGKALGIFDQIENQDIFSASAAGTTRFTINNVGAVGLTSGFGVGGQCLQSNGSGSAASWGACGSSSINYWQLNGPVLSPGNSTVDFAIGGITTASAKFAITGVAGSQSPVATLSATTASGGNGNGISLDGSTSTIQSLRQNTLTLGGTTTGDIKFVNTSNSTTLNIRNNQTVSIGADADPLGWAKFYVAGGGFRADDDFRFQKAAGTQYIARLNPAGSGGASGYDLAFQVRGDNLTMLGAGGLIINNSADSNNYFQVKSGNQANSVYVTGNTGNLGLGTATPTSQLYVTRPLASGANGKALAVFDQIENQDILTASAGGSTKLVLTNNGSLNLVGGQTSDIDTLTGTTLKIGGSTATTISLGRSGQGITLPGFTAQNGVLYGTNGTGVLAQATTSTSGLCLTSGGSNPTWATCPGSTTDVFWTQINGAVYPTNPGVDLLVGGTATASAKFGLINVLSGTPTATIAGTVTNANTFLTGNGNLGTTSNQTLALGGAGTGNISISPLNGGAGSALTINALTTNLTGTTTLNASSLATFNTASTLAINTATLNASSLSALNTASTLAINTSTLTASSLATFTTASSLSMGSTSTLTLASNATINGGTSANDDLTLQGTTNGTRTTSYVNLQPNGGLVGIGTATPGQVLDVLTSANSQQNIRITNSSNGSSAQARFNLVNDQGGNGAAVFLSSSGAASPYVNAVGFWNYLNGPIAFATNNIERGRFSETGNFGLGLTNPNSELYVTRALSAGANGKALAVFDQIENQDILAASASGATKLALTNTGLLKLVGGQTSDLDTLTATTFNIGATNATTISLGRSGQGITLPGFTTAGGVFYANGSGVLGQTTAGSGGQCLTSTGGGAPTWGPCAGGSGTNWWNMTNGLLYPINETLDFALGGTASNAAEFAVTGLATGTPTATVSATTNGNGISFTGSTATLQSLNLGTLTIGGATTGNIVIDSGSSAITLADSTTIAGNLSLSGTTGITETGNGAGLSFSGSGNHDISVAAGTLRLGSVTLNGTTTTSFTGNNAVIYGTTGTGVLTSATSSIANQCLVSGAGGTNTPGWTTCASGQDAFWGQSQGLLFPNNSTVDFAIGGQATTSAKFAITNVAAALSPIATLSATTVSGGSGNGIVLDSTGSIQSLRNNSLTLGGTTTGNINISPLNGAAGSNLTINSVNATLNGTTSLNATSLASFDTSSSLILGTTTLTLDSNSTINGGSAANDDLTLQGTSNGTKTTSYVNLQPSGGLVGIGTTTPLSTLNVIGNVCVGDSTTNCGSLGNGQLRVRGAGGIVDLKATGGAIDLTSTTALYINNDQNSDIYLAPGTSNGKIGIGTTTPTSELYVTRALNKTVTGKALAIFDQIENQDIFTASAGGTTRFTVNNVGAIGLTSGFGSPTQCLTSNGSGSAAGWSACSGGGANYWQLNGPVLSPGNLTVDLAIGGTTTASAKFAITGVAGSQSPVATLSATTASGGDGAGIVLDSGTSSIQSLLGRTLNIGGSTTGNIILNPRSGTGSVGINNSNPTQMLSVGTSGGSGTIGTSTYYDIDNTSFFLDPAATGNALVLAGNQVVSTGKWHGLGASAGRIQFDDLTTDQVSFFSANVGIGTDALPINNVLTSKFQVFSDLGTTPAASISAKNTTGPALLVTNDGPGDLFAASKSGSINFVIRNNGDIIIGPSGTGKITNATSDPLYTIDGTRYSTYGSSMLGVKEEITGNIDTTYNSTQGAYAYTMDFNSFNKNTNTDLWVFSRVIDPDLSAMSILLTPNSQARTWYRMDPVNRKVTFYSDRPTEISYRLTAPRFDHAIHGTVSDEKEISGLIAPPAPNPVGNGNSDGQDSFLASLSIQTYNGTYRLVDSFGNAIYRIEAFSNLTAANIKAGIIDTQKLTSNSLNITSDSVNVAGRSLHDYIASVVNDMAQSGQIITNGQNITSPLASIDQVKTNLISPLGGNEVTVKGSLAIKNSDNKTVAKIDDAGNASFSGSLTVNSATISGDLAANSITASNSSFLTSNIQDLRSNDATVSGTLYANNIEANSITGLDAKIQNLLSNQGSIASLSSQNITAYQMQLASSSGTLAGLLSGQSSVVSSQLLDIQSISADFGTFRDGLVALGPATFGQITALDSFSIGTSLTIGSNSIDTLGQDLNIQPLKQGAVDFLAGAVRIETDGTLKIAGNAEIAGNLKVKGNLTAGMISPLAGKDLKVNLPDDSQFSVHGASDSAVLAVNNQGNVVASGSGTFNKLNLSLAQQAFATSDTEAIATGSAGTAILKQYRSEITIVNPNVTANSLIYITPVGNTSNKVLYLLRQVPGTSFTVGLSTPSTVSDIKFNWIIVN